MNDGFLFYIKQLEQISTAMEAEQLAKSTVKDEDLKIIS